MKVLVPLDNSEASREIVPIVAPIAKALGATITLFSAFEPVAGSPAQRTVSEPSADLVGVVGLTSADLEVAEPAQPEWWNRRIVQSRVRRTKRRITLPPLLMPYRKAVSRPQ